MGKGGAYGSNIEKDYHRWHDVHRKVLGIEMEIAEIKFTKLMNDKSLLEEIVPHPCFPPHELLATVYKIGGMAWDQCILGPQGQAGIDEFWRHEREKPYFQNHPDSRLCPVIFVFWLYLMAIRPMTPTTSSPRLGLLSLRTLNPRIQT